MNTVLHLLCCRDCRSEVGPWEPTADLGQLIISDVKPEVFVPNMRALVQAYWERLVAKGACGPHTRVSTRSCPTWAVRVGFWASWRGQLLLGHTHATTVINTPRTPVHTCTHLHKPLTRVAKPA